MAPERCEIFLLFKKIFNKKRDLQDQAGMKELIEMHYQDIEDSS